MTPGLSPRRPAKSQTSEPVPDIGATARQFTEFAVRPHVVEARAQRAALETIRDDLVKKGGRAHLAGLVRGLRAELPARDPYVRLIGDYGIDAIAALLGTDPANLWEWWSDADVAPPRASACGKSLTP